MIIFCLFLLLMIFIPAPKYARGNDIFDDYLSPSYIKKIKGIFVYLIFCAHFRKFYIIDGTLDILYNNILSALNQLIPLSFFILDTAYIIL